MLDDGLGVITKSWESYGAGVMSRPRVAIDHDPDERTTLTCVSTFGTKRPVFSDDRVSGLEFIWLKAFYIECHAGRAVETSRYPQSGLDDQRR